GTPDDHSATVPPDEVAIMRAAATVAGPAERSALEVTIALHERRPELFAEAVTGDGGAGQAGGLTRPAAAGGQGKITDCQQRQGVGKARVNYKLRDWLFSRQRYWGEPFPILHEVDAEGRPTGLVRPLSVEELPLTLPQLEDYRPSGKPEPPLGKATDWIWV